MKFVHFPFCLISVYILRTSVFISHQRAAGMSWIVLLGLAVLHSVTVLAGRCEDCNTVVAGLQSAALSNESLAMQQGMIVNMICVDAGLGGPDDHPNCEK